MERERKRDHTHTRTHAWTFININNEIHRKEFHLNRINPKEIHLHSMKSMKHKTNVQKKLKQQAKKSIKVNEKNTEKSKLWCDSTRNTFVCHRYFSCIYMCCLVKCNGARARYNDIHECWYWIIFGSNKRAHQHRSQS